MDKVSQIRKGIREIAGVQLNLPFTAQVTAVQDETCSVELKSGLKLTDVKLKATINQGDNYIVVKPTVGSTVVMISLSGGLENLSVIKVDSVSTIELKQNGLEILIDSTDQKVQIKNSTVSLVDVLSDLSTTLQQLKVFTPVGPSGTPLPDTILALQQFDLKIKQLLK